jgi:uncharacterized protein
LELLQNHAFVVSFLAWAIAQMLKVIIILITKRHLDLSRFVGAGGMPSSHSALVAALATSIAMQDGVKSTTFALALAFAGIVMYDAAGVRHAVSVQARLLNRLIDEFVEKQSWNEKRLRELLGHTRVEVVAGFALGVAIAFLWPVTG